MEEKTSGKKAFSFWKILLLKLSNHQLELNNQLKHFAVDEAGVRIKPDCTFCTLGQNEPPPPESYAHLFLECEHSLQALTPIAEKYNRPLPNMTTKGELVLYFFPWEGYWDELRINIFYAIYKYVLMCRTRKGLPTSILFETTLKYKCKNIIMTNPTDKDLTKNLLPLWTGR